MPFYNFKSITVVITFWFFFQNYIPDSAGGFVDLDFLFWISDSVSRIGANWVELGFGLLGAGGGINTENKMEIDKWIPQCIKQTNSSNFCLFFFIGLVYVW